MPHVCGKPCAAAVINSPPIAFLTNTPALVDRNNHLLSNLTLSLSHVVAHHTHCCSGSRGLDRLTAVWAIKSFIIFIISRISCISEKGKSPRGCLLHVITMFR